MPALRSDSLMSNVLGYDDEITVTLKAPHRVFLFTLGILSTVEDPSYVIMHELVEPILSACLAFDAQKEGEGDATKRPAH